MRSITRNFMGNKEYSILLLLVLLNIIIRLPITPHEIGSDSFAFHQIANRISMEHKVKWTFYLWEFFSQDSSSSPIMVPLNLSIFSQYTGLNIEVVILFFSIFLGIVGTLSSYLMAREISEDRFFRFFVTFCFSISPIFVSFTLWTTSTRNMFITLLPLFIWCLLRFENTRKKIYICLAFFIFILLIPVHHMFILTYAIWVAFIITEIYFHVKTRIKSITNRLPLHLPTILFLLFASILLSLFFVANTFLEILTLNMALFVLILILWCIIYLLRERYLYLKTKIVPIPRYLPIVIPILLVFLFIFIFLPQFFSGLPFFEKLKWTYHSGMFFEGWSIHILFLNMCIDYGSSEGILLPFALIGFFTMIKDVNKDKRYLFLILSLLPCTALLIHGEYMTIFLSPLFAVLIGFGLLKSIDKLRKYKRVSAIFIVGCVIISLLFSSFMMHHWVLSRLDRAGNTGGMQERTYQTALFLKSTEGSITTNDNLFARRMGVYLHPIAIGWAIELMPYTYESERAQKLISENKIEYLVENQNIPHLVTGSSQLYPARFLTTVHDKKDKLYDNGLQGIWSLE